MLCVCLSTQKLWSVYNIYFPFRYEKFYIFAITNVCLNLINALAVCFVGASKGSICLGGIGIPIVFLLQFEEQATPDGN